MKLPCFPQIETCLFILHGFQFGYLQKLICQKRRKLTVMTRQTFTKLLRQCFLAGLAVLLAEFCSMFVLGLSLSLCIFCDSSTFSPRFLIKRESILHSSRVRQDLRQVQFSWREVRHSSTCSLWIHWFRRSFLWSAGRMPNHCQS